jgi:hypothetical protein
MSSTNAVMGVVPTTSSKKAKSTNKNSGKVKSSSKGDSHVSSKDTSQETSRPRSDSVSDIVTAKLGEKTAKTDADKTVKNAPTATPQSVRGKRGRGEETEATASTHKRSRQSNA